MTETSPARARAQAIRRRTAGGTTLAGIVVLAGAALTALSWRNELPDPVASHWGANGSANGFSSLNSILAVMLVGGLVLVLGFGAITLWLGHSAFTRRIGAAATIWSALFLAIVTVGSLWVQRGLTDARNASEIDGVLLAAFIVSFVASAIVGALVPGDPRQPTSEPVDPAAPRAALTPGAPAMWTGRATSATAIWSGLIAAALVLGLVVVTQIWALAVVAVLVFGLIAAMSSVIVHVDDGGVTIRSPLGWPRMRIQLDEVRRADVIEVRPLRDFGGWGWRVGRSGRVGVALRRGESLLVERTGDRSVAVTVDGARVAAGLINALTDRARVS